MDHSWGRNVSDVGLGGLGATLAARYHEFAFGDWYVTNEPAGAEVRVWRVVLDPASDVFYSWAMRPKLAPHFPYGLDVDPDVPL